MNSVYASFRRRVLNQFLYFSFCDVKMSTAKKKKKNEKKRTMKPFEFLEGHCFVNAALFQYICKK